MTAQPSAAARRATATAAAGRAAPESRTHLKVPRWLLLVHQLPATPSNLRVRTWRRLQQPGALPVKQAVDGDAAVNRLASVVHDLDVKDARFGA
jgi:hypothetical protein